MNTAKLHKIIDGSPEGFYWLGFLLADGHFSKKNRLQLQIAVKDREHLNRFAQFIEFQGVIHDNYRNNSILLGVSDQKMVPVICEKYDIRYNKTHFPPDISVFSHLEPDQWLALALGYIDGDGSIIKKNDGACSLSLVGHKKWWDFIALVFRQLKKLSGCKIYAPRLDREGYVRVQIKNHAFNKFLKREGTRLKLPFLDRKWSKIDMDFVSKRERREQLSPKIIEFIKQGWSKRRIANELSVNYFYVSNLIKDHKLITLYNDHEHLRATISN